MWEGPEVGRRELKAERRLDQAGRGWIKQGLGNHGTD